METTATKKIADLPGYSPRTLATLTSHRFHNEPRTVEIIGRVPGTTCYVVDLLQSRARTAYATTGELSEYSPELAAAEYRAAQQEWELRNPR